MSTISAIFRWRLDQGKWADVLLEVLPQFLDSNTTHDWEFHIFGTGVYYDDFVTLSKQYPQITLHGRATRDQIKPVAQAWHYCLYPSTCLETFGMTALEWCKLWLPVIWPSKWWLQQFIIQDFCRDVSSVRPWIKKQEVENLSQQLIYIDQHHDQEYNNRQTQTLQISSQFWPDAWLRKINELI